jgi:hypothetical protein
MCVDSHPRNIDSAAYNQSSGQLLLPMYVLVHAIATGYSKGSSPDLELRYAFFFPAPAWAQYHVFSCVFHSVLLSIPADSVDFLRK